MINIAELEKKFNSLNKFNLVFASFFFSLMTLCVKNIDKRIPIYELVFFRSLLSLITTLFIIKIKNILYEIDILFDRFYIVILECVFNDTKER